MLTTAFIFLTTVAVALGGAPQPARKADLHRPPSDDDIPHSARPIGKDDRIINGQNAVAGQYPWQVSLQYYSTGEYWWHYCGGAFISNNYIMSAAHCHYDPSVYMMRVYAGSVQKYSGGQSLSMATFLNYPGYNDDTLAYDVAIVGLSSPVSFSNAIGQISIPGSQYTASTNFAGPGYTTGWGYVHYEASGDPDNVLPETLQVADDVPILTDSQCSNYWGSWYLSSSMMCAGTDGQGTCKGDSGGPMVQVINGVHTLVGVTSFGTSTCSLSYPGGKGKLSSVRSWIISNTDL